MAEDLYIPESFDKKEIYEALLPQTAALVDRESDLIANMANVAAALKQTMGHFWVGFYLNKEDELVLGPFQGPVACTRIAFGKGVCGTAMQRKETIIVPDVEEFPGHIACNSLSKSEIVVPLTIEGEVVFVLDVDSDRLNDFDHIDDIYLNKIAGLLTKHYIRK